MSAHQDTYPIATMCQVLGVSTSGILRVGTKRVARLMRRAGLEGVSRRRGKKTTTPNPQARPHTDLVNRDFNAEEPDELWVSDLTYISTWAGFLHLAVVVDAFSRRVAGWAMATHLRTELVQGTLDMAIYQRRPRGIVLHSDQGSQYTSLAFGARGDALDNALCESFFATLECELSDRRRFQTHTEAWMAVFEYIEGFYNPLRLHSGLDYMSPVEYERRYLDQAQERKFETVH